MLIYLSSQTSQMMLPAQHANLQILHKVFSSFLFTFLGSSRCLLFSLAPKLGVYETSGQNDHYMYLNIDQQTLPNGLVSPIWHSDIPGGWLDFDKCDTILTSWDLNCVKNWLSVFGSTRQWSDFIQLTVTSNQGQDGEQCVDTCSLSQHVMVILM